MPSLHVSRRALICSNSRVASLALPSRTSHFRVQTSQLEPNWMPQGGYRLSWSTSTISNSLKKARRVGSGQLKENDRGGQAKTRRTCEGSRQGPYDQAMRSTSGSRLDGGAGEGAALSDCCELAHGQLLLDGVRSKTAKRPSPALTHSNRACVVCAFPVSSYGASRLQMTVRD